MKQLLDNAVRELIPVLERLHELEPAMEKLAQSMLDCWSKRGKVMVAGNGGSAADAMHLAEELSVRFLKNRRALAAIALCDPTAITCAGNDFGFERIFARQVEALGQPGDILIVLSTSGNSANIVQAVEQAKSQQVITVGMIGKDGGKLKGMCDIELLIPGTQNTARIQEAQKLLYHTLCHWIDDRTM